MVKRRLGFIVAGVVLLPMLLMLIKDPDLSIEKRLVEDMAELKELVDSSHSKNRLRMEDIAILSQSVNSLLGPDDLNSTWKGMVLSPSQRSFLSNYSIEKTLRLPSIYSYLPHLLDDPKSTTPAFMLSKGRTDAKMVLGVPTVQREVQSYLLTTLSNLVKCMSSQERNTSIIIVFVAETDLSYVHKVASLVEKNLPEYLESGLIEIISPPASFYPDLNSLKQTLGDKQERVKWRTKQNLDFAFLMMYAQSKGLFYVQLEDDVLTRDKYISTMKSFALKKTSEKLDWFVLDFCQLGFIGKMFKCAELPYLIQFFLMFANDKPVDWLLDYLIQTKSCNLDKDVKDCKKAKANVWVRYKPSLFQHIGTHSSLKGKVQKLKDKQFGKVAMHFPHSNPPATLQTNIKPYKAFTFTKAYKGENYFWGLLPQQGDEMTIEFNSPVDVERFLFRSGNVEHPSDRFYNTTVEVLPIKVHEEKSPYPTSVDSKESYYVVGKFDDMGLAEGSILPSVGKVKKIKLRVHADSENWAIISEIEIKERGKTR